MPDRIRKGMWASAAKECKIWRVDFDPLLPKAMPGLVFTHFDKKMCPDVSLEDRRWVLIKSFQNATTSYSARWRLLKMISDKFMEQRPRHSSWDGHPMSMDSVVWARFWSSNVYVWVNGDVQKILDRFKAIVVERKEVIQGHSEKALESAVEQAVNAGISPERMIEIVRTKFVSLIQKS